MDAPSTASAAHRPGRGRVFDSIVDAVGDTPIVRLRKLPPALNIPCKGLFSFAVRHDGNVRLCGCRLTRNDMDDLVVGNIREHSLQEISKGPVAWEKIKGFYSGKRPETCLECTFYRPIDQDWLLRRINHQPASPAPKAPVAAVPV